MEAVVVWTEFAESKLTIVFNYYKEKASLKIATQITKEIVKASMKLEKQPFIGALEPLHLRQEQKNTDIWFKEIIRSSISLKKRRMKL